jgi:hypothetical protein
MKRRNKQEKVYHSIMEIEEEFLPESYKERVKKERQKIPGTFGSDLAKEFLEDIRRQLTKRA